MKTVFILVSEGIVGRDMEPLGRVCDKAFANKAEAEKHMIPFAREIAEDFPPGELEELKATKEEPLADLGYLLGPAGRMPYENIDSERIGVEVIETTVVQAEEPEFFDKYRAAAKRRWADDGVIEFDDDPKISHLDDPDSDEGAYVQAWIWVSDVEAGLKEEE